jgi:hypothetical protein
MIVRIETDIDFDHGKYANSGVHQWENETLVAVQWPSTTSDRCRVVELPARAVTLCTTRRRFATIEQAEEYIAAQWGDRALLVTSEDIAEEIGRRKAMRHQPTPRTAAFVEVDW